MKEYIEREAGCAVMPDDYYGWRDKKLLKSIPAADVRPVVRGKWKRAEPFDNLSKPCKDDADSPICTKASPASLGIYKKAEEGET